MEIEIIVLVALLIFSIIDIRFKAIPSVFTTTLLFILAILESDNLRFAIILFVFGLLLYDVGYFNGIADLKAMAIIGFLIPTFNYLVIFILTFMFIGFLYTLFMRIYIKEKGEMPFIPPIFISYLLFYIFVGRGLIW